MHSLTTRSARFELAKRASSVLAAGQLLWAAALSAQTGAGAIQGTVLAAADSLPVPQAAVLLAGTELGTTTDETGSFRLVGVGDGRYTVRVIAAGYRTGVRADVQVAVGEVRRLNVLLERSVVDVPGILVTASRGRASPGEPPASVAVLGSDEIFRRNVSTLEDALPFAQGVIYNAGQLDIRGASGLSRGVGSRVLVLLDGHRLLTGAGSEADFETFPLLDVDRVEVVKGPHSSLYGTSALGGVVNVITGRPPVAPETVVQAYYGAYDTPSEFRFTDDQLSTQGLGVQHSRRIGRVGTTLYFGAEDSDGFRQNGKRSRRQVRAKTVFPADSDRPLEAFVNWTRRDNDEFFTWLSRDRPLEVEPEEEGDWLREENVAVGLTARPVSKQALLLEVRPQFVYSSVQNHFHDNEDHHKTSRFAADAQLSLNPSETHTVTTGAEAARTGVSSNFLGEPSIVDLATYAQDEVAITRQLKGTAGLRLDYHKAESSESDLVLNPKLGLVYRPAEGVSLRASLSRGYRAPSPSEQYTSTVQFGFRVVPNLELRGETALAGELGVSAQVGGWLTADAAVFYSEYDDLIEPAPVPGQLFTFQFRNVAEARVRGLDAGVGVGLLDNLLALKANYVFLDTEDRRTGRPLPYRSTHNLTVTLDAIRQALGIDVRYRSRVKEVLAFPLDPREPITVVDLRLAYRVLGVVVMAKVSNLFQTSYVDVQERNPGPSRHFRLSIMPRF
jgi:iron complex outermembrane receptor protein